MPAVSCVRAVQVWLCVCVCVWSRMPVLGRALRVCCAYVRVRGVCVSVRVRVRVRVLIMLDGQASS